MKKVLAVIAVVAVVCVAGAALAQPRGRDDARRMPPQLQQAQQGQQPQQGQPGAMGYSDQRRPAQKFDRPEGFGEKNCRFGGMDRDPRQGRGRKNGPGFGRMMFAPDMPEEIRAKVVEAAKLKIDLEAALATKPVDKAKAMEIFGKIQQTENEVEVWKFGKKIDMMEAFRTQQELNRKMPPAPKPEAPAPAPEAPAPEK